MKTFPFESKNNSIHELKLNIIGKSGIEIDCQLSSRKESPKLNY